MDEEGNERGGMVYRRGLRRGRVRVERKERRAEAQLVKPARDVQENVISAESAFGGA